MTGSVRIGLVGRAERFGRWVENVLLALALAAMVALAAAQIALRNFGGAGLVWADEALRLLVLWVTMLGAVAASRDQRHVSIDALSRYLPHRWLRGIGRLLDVFVAAVCFVLAWYSWQFVADALAADDRVLGGAVPAWSVQLILPVAFALVGYRYTVAGLAPRRPMSVSGAGH
ncbi:MAG: TRAP transporter small permease [Gammaproteobacteria bacterium]|nr:TRAP transporter small permease [Gammaproteobacteria bacterium]